MNIGSVFLDCYAVDCTLSIRPPNGKGKQKVTFGRKHLLYSEPVKVDKDGKYIRMHHDHYSEEHARKGRRSFASNTPDADGHFDSYAIHVSPQIATNDQHYQSSTIEGNTRSDIHGKLEAVRDYASVSSRGNYVFYMRMFSLGTTGRLTRKQVSRIDTYIQEITHTLSIKEHADYAWQGIVGLIVGILMLLATVLLGEFVDQSSQRKNGRGAPYRNPNARERPTL